MTSDDTPVLSTNDPDTANSDLTQKAGIEADSTDTKHVQQIGLNTGWKCLHGNISYRLPVPG